MTFEAIYYKLERPMLTVSCFFALASGLGSPQPSLPASLRGIKRILVLGDSITYLGGYVDLIDTTLRRQYLSSRIELINIGLPSETVSGLTEPNHAGGAFPRPDLRERLDRALTQTKPDLVMACYGVNDGIYSPFSKERFDAFKAGILNLQNAVAKKKARLWLLTPFPFDPQPIRGSVLPIGKEAYPSGSPFEGYDSVLTKYSDWLVSQRRSGWNVIDIHKALDFALLERRKTDPSFVLATDGVHEGAMGHRIVAREVLRTWGLPENALPVADQVQLPGLEKDSATQFEKLVHDRQRLLCDAWLTAIGHKRPGMPVGVPLAEAKTRADELERQISALGPTVPPMFSGMTTDYHGFDRHDFKVDGINVVVVSPKELTSPGSKPWIWRAEFFDHRPELDLALLARGFHLVYVEVGNTFGCPSAMKHWDACYRTLTHDYGLSRKPVLEGLSRGGLYIYNWAAMHPKCVSVLYGDNPVCDFKSWPGGKGHGPGSPEDWAKLQRDYGFKNEQEALAYKLNPIDHLKPLAAAGVPIIHCAADADEVVPYEENTVILKKRYEDLGGKMEVIVKHGYHHHPHGLDDPEPLVKFILDHTVNL